MARTPADRRPMTNEFRCTCFKQDARSRRYMAVLSDVTPAAMIAGGHYHRSHDSAVGDTQRRRPARRHGAPKMAKDQEREGEIKRERERERKKGEKKIYNG